MQNLTPTIQNSQVTKYEILNRPSLVLKNMTIPFIPSSQWYQLPSSYDPILLYRYLHANKTSLIV